MSRIFGSDDLEELGELLKPWEGSSEAATETPGLGRPQANSQSLGANTGAPPRTKIYQVQVTAAGIRLVGPDKASRQVTITVPVTGFGVFLGFSGRPNVRGFPIPPAFPYEITIPGFEEVWAATNAPVFIPVLVQVGPLLGGDRERRWEW